MNNFEKVLGRFGMNVAAFIIKTIVTLVLIILCILIPFAGILDLVLYPIYWITQKITLAEMVKISYKKFTTVIPEMIEAISKMWI